MYIVCTSTLPQHSPVKSTDYLSQPCFMFCCDLIIMNIKRCTCTYEQVHSPVIILIFTSFTSYFHIFLVYTCNRKHYISALLLFIVDILFWTLVAIKPQNSLSWQSISLIEILKTENSSSSTSGLRLDVFWKTSTSTTVQARRSEPRHSYHPIGLLFSDRV